MEEVRHIDYENPQNIDLNDVPCEYVHHRCGGVTVMPDEIIRTYLFDPYSFSRQTICATCNGAVDQSECSWVDTGQNLDEYFKQLTKLRGARFQKVRLLASPITVAPLAVLIGLVVGLIKGEGLLGWIVGFGAGGAMAGALFARSLRGIVLRLMGQRPPR